MNKKILVFVVKDDKFLIVKGSENDPQFHESFWYVITGGVELYDVTDEEAVKREVKEESNLNVENVEFLNWTFIYESMGQTCCEKAFACFYNSGEILLNEENEQYKWCSIEEVINTIKWYGSKERLRYVLNCILNKKMPFEKETIEKF